MRPTAADDAAGGCEPLFAPFRALGYITDDVPFAIQRRGKETFVTVSVGRTWQLYNGAKLSLVGVGPQLDREVCALATKGDLTFAAAGNTIQECRRFQRSGTYCGHEDRIGALMVLGDMLFSISANERRMLGWRIGDYAAPQVRLELDFAPLCMTHPDTYLNKVVLGGADGRLQLWNFATGTLLYTFAGWGSAVRCVVSSPALDVVGVGLADGRVVLHNLRADRTVTTFHNAAGAGTVDEPGDKAEASAPRVGKAASAVAAIAFRTGAGLPLMAAGGGAGAITVWDLEGRRLHSVVRDAHDAPLLALHFFAGEPVLLSSGRDNAIKQWVFDHTAAGAGVGEPAPPRLLRFRSGHSAPPRVVQHYGGGLRLLSGGADRAFRVFSTIQDQQSRELSQRNTARRAKRLRVHEAELKLPPITALAACEVRERDWCNVVTVHKGDPTAYTWRLAHFALGEHQLLPPATELEACTAGGQPAPATAVAISPCGNFGLVGSAAGRVDRYNLQSGLHRGAYYRNPARSSEVTGGPGSLPKLLPAHAGAVMGLAVGAANRMLISAGRDGVLATWDFHGGVLRTELAVGGPISQLALHSASGLAALAVEGLGLRVFDAEAARLVRRFSAGHRERVTALQMSSDARWLLSASMDGTLRVWDIPAAQCLQVMRLGSPVTALSLSPALDLLATTHVNKRGIFLWTNQMLFGDPSAIAAYTGTIIDAALPTINTRCGHQRLPVLAGSEPAVVDSTSEEEDTGSVVLGEHEVERHYGENDAGDREQQGTTCAEDNDANAAAGAARTESWPYEASDGGGAPVPIAPALATLSLLPRTQWEQLLHLDAIKARSKPVAPPTKPDAAPFFLPTLPSLAPKPAFDVAVNSDQQRAAGAHAAPVATGVGTASGHSSMPGWPSEDEPEDGGADEGPQEGPRSRVLHSSNHGTDGDGGSGIGNLGLPPSEFVRLLRAGAESNNYAGFISELRGMSAAAVDRELRMLTLAPGEAACRDVVALLGALEAEVAAHRNFELVQALLGATLRHNADAIISQPSVSGAAARLRRCLAPAWRKLDQQLQAVRCMADFYGGLQV